MCRGQVEGEQEIERFARHWAGKHVAADHHPIDVGAANLFEHRFERREVAVNVVERRDAHRLPFRSASLDPTPAIHPTTLDETPPEEQTEIRCAQLEEPMPGPNTPYLRWASAVTAAALLGSTALHGATAAEA